MSLIYKSLQQLKKEEESKKLRPRLQSPQAVSSGLRIIIVRASLILLVLGVLAWGATSWIRSELQEIMLNNAQQTTRLVRNQQKAEPEAAQSQASRAGADMTNDLPEITPVVEPPTLLQPKPKLAVPQHKKVVVQPQPQESAPQPQTSPLEQRFTQQARKNQHLLKVSNQMKTTKAGDDTNKHLQTIAQELGPRATFSLKWQAYTALKNKNYTKAETLYKQVVATSPADRESRLNLILALLGQNKKAQARVLYEAYVQDFPTDQMGRRLQATFHK